MTDTAMVRLTMYAVGGILVAPLSAYIIVLLLSPFIEFKGPRRKRVWLAVTAIIVSVNVAGWLLFMMSRR